MFHTREIMSERMDQSDEDGAFTGKKFRRSSCEGKIEKGGRER